MLEHLPEFYKGKRVFLTGHTGFKGSWMLYWLHSMGAIVKGYALAPESSDDLYCQINGDVLCSSDIADIRDRDKLEKSLLSFQPDIIFHFAAQPLVRLSYDIPEDTFEVNAMGTGYLLSALRKINQPCTVILITTDKVYENKEWVYPYRETDRLGGLDPYSASKAAAEILIHSYTHSFFHIKRYEEHKKAIAVARAGNVIGGGDWAKDRIIPDIIRSLKVNEDITVRNPNAIRPWQHVLEPLGGYLLLAKRISENPVQFSGAWNFGPLAEDTFTVKQVVEKAIQVWGSGKYETPELKGQPHEAGLLKLDISKAQAELGWKPRWNADEAIATTISWYRQFQQGKKAAAIVQSDIDAYLNSK